MKFGKTQIATLVAALCLFVVVVCSLYSQWACVVPWLGKSGQAGMLALTAILVLIVALRSVSRPIALRISAIIALVLSLELLMGYAFFWPHAQGWGGLHEAILFSAQRLEKYHTNMVRQVQPPSTILHSNPGPFYRDDPELGMVSNFGRQIVTMEHGALQYAFEVTTLIDGDRITRRDAWPSHPQKTIWIFGDSWIHGWGNTDETSFAFILQSRMPENMVRNFAFGGGCNTTALIKMRQLIRNAVKPIPDVVVMGYADFYPERNIAAPSRLSQYQKRFTSDFVPEGTQWVHPRARNVDGQLAIDIIPLFCEDNHLCNLPNPPAAEQYELTKLVLSEARKIFPSARYFLAYLRGPDDDPVFVSAASLGYEVIDLRPKTSLEWDDFSPLDTHPGPKANVAYANKVERAILCGAGHEQDCHGNDH